MRSQLVKNASLRLLGCKKVLGLVFDFLLQQFIGMVGMDKSEAKEWFKWTLVTVFIDLFIFCENLTSQKCIT